MLRGTLITGLCVIASGCTIVHIHTPDGNIRVEKQFLSTGIVIEDNYVSRTIQTRGIGFSADSRSFLLGAYSRDTALLGPECRAVLWFSNAEEYKKLAPLVNASAGVCLAKTSMMKANGGDP